VYADSLVELGPTVSGAFTSCCVLSLLHLLLITASSRPGSSLEMTSGAVPAGQGLAAVGTSAAQRPVSPTPAARAAGISAQTSFNTRVSSSC
jgi:hypothetical protein